MRTVVITGAGRGLGLAMARRAGQDGFRTVLAELDPERGEPAARTLRDEGLDAHFVPCDVADPASVDALASAVAALGPLHGLVNNAALANGVGGKEFQDITVAEWDRLMAVNARSPGWSPARCCLSCSRTATAGASSTSRPTRRCTARCGSPTTSPPRAR